MRALAIVLFTIFLSTPAMALDLELEGKRAL